MRYSKILLIFIIAMFFILGLAVPVMANPTLRVVQTVPDTYILDTTGETYIATITNVGDTTAQNIAVKIVIPAGFSLIGTPTAVYKTDSNDSGISLPITVTTDSSSFSIAFNPALSLKPNEIAVITYQLATTQEVTPGDTSVNTITVKENYDYQDVDDNTVQTNENYEHLVYVKQGQIKVTLTPVDPNPLKASRGDTITLEAKLTNTGDGPLYNVNFQAAWGDNFSSAVLISNESNISPQPSGNAFVYNNNDLSHPLQAGDSIYFEYQLTISDYQTGKFNLSSSATSSPDSPGNPASASTIFNFVVYQPSISIIADKITMDYGDNPTTAHIVIKNNGNGPARQFSLNTDINTVFTISDVSSGWTYAGGVFTYQDEIKAGDSVTLTFAVTPASPQSLLKNPVTGTILITPSYLNDIDQPFSYPVTYQSYEIDNVPTLNLSQIINSEATDGDNSRIYLGEEIQFVLTPTLTLPGKWKAGTDIVLTEVVPNGLSIDSFSASGVGTLVKTDNKTLQWTLTPDQANNSPSMMINLTATSNPDEANTTIVNSATVSGTTLCCNLSVTRNVSLYLQSRDSTADFSYESKTLVNKPAEGSYDVGGKDGKNLVEYQVEYNFGASSGGFWTDSVMSDLLDQAQTYFNDALHQPQYRIGTEGDWTPIPTGSIHAGTTLDFDLSFLTGALGGNAAVQGQRVFFRYWLELTDASLPLGSGKPTSDTFTSVTKLVLNGATGGAGVGNVFYEGVFVPISRAALNLGIHLGSTEVSKGQRVHATLQVSNVQFTSINGDTPWNKKDLVISVTTPTASGSSNGSYSYRGPLTLDTTSVSGFNGQIPQVVFTSDTPEKVQFVFSSPVTEGGTIAFDLVKTDSNNYTIQTGLSFKDDLGDTSNATASYTPTSCEQGKLSIIVSPDPIQIISNSVTWQIQVTNIGDGTAYGVVVEDNLNGVLNYVSSTTTATAATTIQDGSKITWSLGDIQPGIGQTITITVGTNGNSDFTTKNNQVTGKLSWVDRSLAANYFNAVTLTNSPDLININSTSSTFVENLCSDHVELGSYATIRLHVKNNGSTTNYNYSLKQDFKDTGFVYQAGTAKIDGVSFSDDPYVTKSGTSLTFSELPQFKTLAPQGEFTLTFDVYAPESFNSHQRIQPSATWQLPTDRSDSSDRNGSITGAEFLVPQYLANINVQVKGKNITVGDVDYTDNVIGLRHPSGDPNYPGDIVEWQVQIQNSGSAAAKKPILKNILPINMTFISMRSADDSISKTEDGPWNIPDIDKGTTVTYYIKAQFTGDCRDTQKDTASVTWGPETSSLSTPGNNTDSANLITQAVINSVKAEITDFTTKNGIVTVTLKTSGAPLHDLTLPLDITSRFQVSSAMSYGGGLPAPASEPVTGDSGILKWSWVGGSVIYAGTYTITFSIRDHNTARYCNDDSIVTSTNNYTFYNSNNIEYSGTYDLSATPEKAALTVTKTPTEKVAKSGDAITWTITVTNNGNTAATNLEIVDQLGDGTDGNSFTYQSSSVDSGNPVTPTKNGNKLTWSGINLAVGASYTITENAKVTSTGSHGTMVTAAEWNVDHTQTVDQQSATTKLAVVDFTKTLNQTVTPVNDGIADSFGEIVTYTIQAEIGDQSNYQNMKVTDILPTGLELVDQNYSANHTVTFEQTGQNLSWTIGNFTGSGSETITITYHARIVKQGAVSAGSVLKNSAGLSFDIVNSDNSITSYPSTMAGLQSTASFTVKEPSIFLSSKISDPPSGSSVAANKTIDHTLVVTNVNNTDVSAGYGVQVTETLPSGERAFDPTATITVKKGGSSGTALTGGGTDYTVSYNGTDGTLVFQFLDTGLGILQPGENFTITYQTKIDSNIGAGLSLNNKTTLNQYYSQPSSVTETNKYTNGGSLSTSYKTMDFSYTMKVQYPTTGLIRPGMTVTYQAQITIPAGTTIHDVGLQQTLPTGLDYIDNSSIGLNDGATLLKNLIPNKSGNATDGETITWSTADSNVDITNSSSSDLVLTLTFQALVKNDTNNIIKGLEKQSAFVCDYNMIDGDINSRTKTPGVIASLTVAEPLLTITKTILSSGHYEAGSTLTYCLTVANDIKNTETAYDTQIESLLSDKASYNSSTMQVVRDGQKLTWGMDGTLDIAPGASVSVDVTATLLTTVEPNEILKNSGKVTYSSMNGSVADERSYTASLSSDNDITVNDPTALSKSFVGTPTFVIGDPFEYKLVLTVLKGTTESVVVNDKLPDGLEFEEFTIANAPGNSSMTYTKNSGPSQGATGNISWNLGTVTNPDDGDSGDDFITIQYKVKLLDSASNNAGDSRTNSATASYYHYSSGTLNTNTTAETKQSYIIKEPKLLMTKSFDKTSYNVGDTATVTIQIWHDPGSVSANTAAPAYDLLLSDPIPSGMTYISGSANLSGAADGYGNVGWNMDVPLTWTVSNQLTFTYHLKVDSTDRPGQKFDNTASATWSSVSGRPAGARTGAGGVDDYKTTSAASAQVVDNTALVKTITGSGSYPIGSQVSYKLTITINEGVTTGVKVKDALPSGMKFNSATIQKGSDGLNGNISYTLTNQPVNGATGTLEWDFGDITDQNDGNSTNDQIIINYTAIITDNGNSQGTKLNNSAHLEYFDGTNTFKSTNPSSTQITVVAPALQVSIQEVTNGPYKAGATVTYQVNISHATGSNAEAFDVQISDTLPAGLTYQSNTGSNDPGSPNITGQQIVWGENGNIDIPAGGSYTFQFNAVLDPDIQPGGSFDNSAGVTWTSTDGDNSDEHKYPKVTSNTVTIHTVNDTALTKSILDSPTFVIGETFDYQLTVHITKGKTRQVVVRDTLPDGIAFKSAAISYSPGMTYSVPTNPAAGATGDISWNFGDVTSPDDNDTITIRYTVQILNQAVNKADGTDKTNKAVVSYLDATGNSCQTIDQTTFKVKEPELTVVKSYSVVGVWQAGATVNVNLKIYHTSTDVPFDVKACNVQVTDQIPDKMKNPSGITNIGTVNVDSVSAPNTVTWSNLQMGTSYDSNSPLTLTYQVTLDNSAQPNEQLSGKVTVQWDSGSVSEKRSYSTNYTATTNMADSTALTHHLVGGVENAIGAIVPCQIRIKLNEGTTESLVVKATIPNGLQFDHAEIIKGHSEINYTAPAGSNAGATNLNWNFGNVDNPANGNSTDDTITINYWVIVTKDSTNVGGTTLSIPAHLEYFDGNGSFVNQPAQNADVVLVEPYLTPSKTGPGTVTLNTAAPFTIIVTNTGDGTAWQPVIMDTLPVEMRSQTPALTAAVTVGTRTLKENDDYNLSYNTVTGEWQVALTSETARIAAGETLTIRYQAFLNNNVYDTLNKTITNEASVTQYYSIDSGSGIGTNTRTYSSTVAAAPVTVQTPHLDYNSTVNPTEAYPGDKLHYKTVITNNGNIDVTSGVLTVDSGVEYAPATIQNVIVSTGSYSINGTGGVNGTGRLTVTGVTIAANGGTFTVEWDVILKTFLKNGITVQPTAKFSLDQFPTPVALDMPQTLIKSSNLTGTVWWDQNCDNIKDSAEPEEENWVVEVLQHDTASNSDTLIESTMTQKDGTYVFTGLIPGTGYKVRFKNPTGKTVWSTFENITMAAESTVTQNLPLHPSGIIYDAVTREPVTDATIHISGPVGFDATTQLSDGQQDQVTDSQGFYYFDLSGAPAGSYTISVAPPNNYSPIFPSTIIAPQSGAPANNQVTNNAAPPKGNEATTYYLSFNWATGGTALLNNHIPLDPILAGSVVLTKTAGKKTAAIGDIVPYTILLTNQVSAVITPLTLQDQLPSGFKYVKGSARINGKAVEPTGDTTLSWTKLILPAKGKMTITYALIVGTHVVEDNTYKNSATAYHGITGTAISNTGQALVKVVAEPLFTNSLITGKVFNDQNGNGVQDEGEEGIAGARIITTTGQIITTDKFGRYHLDGIRVPNFGRGQNWVFKVDPRSIPAGMVFTTENPRVVYLTQGLLAKVNFGVRIPPDKSVPAVETVIPTPTPKAQEPTSDSPMITISKVIPGEGFVDTKIGVVIEGSGFRPETQVVFIKDQAVLNPNDLQVVSETQIRCRLDLNGAATGKYDVKVANSDVNSASLPVGFEIKRPQPSLPKDPVPIQKGFNNGSLLVTITVPGNSPAGLKLKNSDGVTIPGVVVGIEKGKIQVFFDLKGKPTGTYDCYAVYPDGRTSPLKNKVQIRDFSPERYHAQTLKPIYFDFDKSNIRNNQKADIEHDLAVIRNNPKALIMLGGYTDERGSFVYNLGLSMRRATAVKQYLVEHGLSPDRITIYSYGKELAQKGSNENIWQNDRRVNVMIYIDNEETTAP